MVGLGWSRGEEGGGDFRFERSVGLVISLGSWDC